MTGKQRDVVVDYDEIAGFVRDLRGQADAIETAVSAEITGISTDLEREASSASADGKPAPIFVDVLAAMGVAMKALDTNAKQLVANLRADASFLENAAKGMQQVDSDGATATAGVDTDTGYSGHQTAPTPTIITKPLPADRGIDV